MLTRISIRWTVAYAGGKPRFKLGGIEYYIER
jgi:hypothetical protein